MLLILLYDDGAPALLYQQIDEGLEFRCVIGCGGCGRCLGIGLGSRFEAGCLHRKYSYGGGAAVLRHQALRYAVYCPATDGGAA